MQLNPISAPDKATAMALIERHENKVVELDYAAGASEILELSRLGRQHGVSVMFRSQEEILVESLRALRRGLETEKGTWRTRHLLCQFELATIPADDLKPLWGRAAELGDIIVPAEAIRAIYTHWKH